MRLREHPNLLGKWPPTWIGKHGRMTKKVYGERPDKLLSVRQLDKTIVLEVRFQNHRYTGYITIDDKNLVKKIYKILQKSLYNSIRSIGSRDLDF